MNEAVISILQGYIDEHLFEPACNWPKCYFDERLYSRWIANEILERVKQQPSTPPIIIIADLINELNECAGVNENTEELFYIAINAAEDILSLFL